MTTTARTPLPEAVATDAASRRRTGRFTGLLRVLARRHRWWAEIAVVLAFYVGYEGTRGLAPTASAAGASNAAAVLSFEQATHLDPERVVNHAVASTSWLSEIAGYYYAILHFGVTICALIALYVWRPELYARARTSLLMASYAALIVFWLVPVAPPRLAETGIVDTVVQDGILGAGPAEKSGAGFVNLYAAMPSLHVGWALWVALAAHRAWRRWGWAAWLYPLATTFVVLATGNHYLLDAVAGAVVVLAAELVVGLVIVSRRRGLRAGTSPAPPATRRSPRPR